MKKSIRNEIPMPFFFHPNRLLEEPIADLRLPITYEIIANLKLMECVFSSFTVNAITE